MEWWQIAAYVGVAWIAWTIFRVVRAGILVLGPGYNLAERYTVRDGSIQE
jgi:hypothetical protein